MKKLALLALILAFVVFTDCMPTTAIAPEATDRSIDVTSKLKGDNWLYIPGANISCAFKKTEFVQEEVDSNDVIYSAPSGEKNPFVIGHNYRSLRSLHKAQVGQYIYLAVDGQLEIYRIIISEKAEPKYNQKGKCIDILGTVSNTSIYQHCSERTLHLYTCYGWDDSDRWIVLAELVS